MSTFSLPSIFVDIPRNPVLAVGLPLAIGTLSGFPTSEVVKSAWYKGLRPPPGQPPRSVFPIVWSVLYVAMGYASHIAVKALDRNLVPAAASKHVGVKLYWAQLGLNLLWTPLFFGLRRPDLALVDIGLLTGTVFYMTKKLDKVTDGATTLLLLPYCAWLSFATYLNAGIWWNNPPPVNKGQGRY